ncbi:ATP-binding protein [Caenimonas koreensis]|uniref:ATP-binding protein n=1 Tax=Caenimonas koreensis TaxID=367474 RepID=UPI0037849A43
MSQLPPNALATGIPSAGPGARTRARPLRMRLLLLTASGLLPLVLLMAWGIQHLIDERQLLAQRSVLDLSRALASTVDAELRSTAVLLDQMSASDDLERGDFRSFYLSARRTVEQLGWQQLIVSDSEGRVLLRTAEPFGMTDPAPVDPKSMARMVARLGPVVTEVMQTPQAPSETFAVRIPVLRSDKLVYVLTAELPADKMLGVLARQSIPAGSIASVRDQSLRQVARSIKAATPFPSPSMRALFDRGTSEGVGRTTTSEGVESYTGFTRVGDWGWYVVVGTSVDGANAVLYDLLRVVALGLAASLALSALLAWVLSRRVLAPIDELKDAAASLGRGDPVAVPELNILELDEVAVALTDAAAERDRAAAEREQLTARISEALRAAEDANRSKDQFLAMLGHELRNPLAPISTAVQIMAMKGDEKTARERRIIERQLVHVTRLVDDLLDVSRITSKRLTITMQPVHIAVVLTQVVETIQSSLYQRFLALELADGAEDAWVTGDEMRLVQVFNNLLVNAIKFTPAGGSIRVKAAVVDGALRIDISDSGIGMSSDDLRRVFDLFYQAPQTLDRARGGLGLGLPIVRSLVEMHGGQVSATSEGIDKGSCITVVLPLCETPATAAPQTAAPLATGAGKVLVVDDNEDAADTCATLLEMSGYTVQTVYDPKSALEAVHEFAADVAILDIGLPGMTGYELAARMREAGYRGRLVALTGYGQTSDIAMAQRAGFDAHLTKPVAPDALLDVVKGLSAIRS